MRSATDRPALESGHETRIEPGSPGRRRRRVLTGSGRRRALTALAAVVAALAGCTAPQPPGPTPTAAPPTPTAPAAGAAAVQAQVDRFLTGQERVDLTNLLRAAERTGDEGQRYRAYVGAWQYVRDLYFQKGQLPEQKALLDALESVGRSFPQYQPADFQVDPATSR